MVRLVTLLVAVCLSMASCVGWTLAADIEISVDASTAVAPISPLLFGTNLHANDESTPAVQTFVRDTGIRIFRWPDATQTADWKTGLWGGEQNGDSLSKSPLATFDGAAKFAREVNATIVAVLNPNLPPSYAVEWLEHAKAINFPIEYWVLGNEPYFADSADYIPVEKYAELARQFSTALKAADPSIRFGVAWGGPYVNEESSPGRDGTLARLVGDCIDFIDYHWYSGRSNDGKSEPLIIVASGERVPQDIAYFRALLKRATPEHASHIEIAYLEWDIFADEPGRQSLANALFYADTLGRFVTSGVSVATCYNLQEKMFGLIPGWCGEGGWGGNPWNGVTIRPKAYALQLWSKQMGDTLVTCRVAGSPSFTPPPNWHTQLDYQGASAPSLVAYAGRRGDGEGLSIMVINKEPEKPLTATLSISGFSPASEARLYLLDGPDYLANNEGEGFISVQPPPPVKVRLQESSLPVPGQRFTHTFPLHSVTVIALSGAK